MPKRPPKPEHRESAPSTKKRKATAPSRATAAPALDKLATAKSRQLLKQLPSEGGMASIVFDLKNRGDQAAVIMGAAYLEHGLELLLRFVFRQELTKEESTRIFDGAQGGILGTFSAKIRVAYAIKLLHRNHYKILMLINDIRNVFAHSLHPIDFSNPLVIEDCQKLASLSDPLAQALALEPFSTESAIDIYCKMVFALYISMRHEIERRTSSISSPSPSPHK